MGKNVDISSFTEFLRRNEKTVDKVAAHFYVCGSYSYQALVAQLVEHLWLAFNALPEGTVIYNEEHWVGLLLFRKALNVFRDDRRYKMNIDIDPSVDLDGLPSPDDENPYIRRLYRLISRLDATDRDFLYLYLDEVPFSEIALRMDITYLSALRRFHRIERILRALNDTMDDDDDEEYTINP